MLKGRVIKKTIFFFKELYTRVVYNNEVYVVGKNLKKTCIIHKLSSTEEVEDEGIEVKKCKLKRLMIISDLFKTSLEVSWNQYHDILEYNLIGKDIEFQLDIVYRG